jgi:three-Cys-motif partner protein
VDISRAVRKKFVGKGGATYIDLFCGPGRARVRETTRIVDGSALAAAKQAIESKTGFTELYIADSNESFLSAASARLDRLGVTTKAYVGTSEHTVQQIAPVLGQFGLHFAFLDPYDLRSLPFTVIERLAGFKHMDILIHVSAQDLQRNLRRYIERGQSPLDSFAPRWRQVVDKLDPDANIRNKIFVHWLGLIRACDMHPAQGVEEVTGTRNQHLYWLVFVARHKLALRFWEDIRNITDQKSWNF